MKYIKFGNNYYQIISEFIYPIDSIGYSRKEYILKDNSDIFYYRLDGVLTQRFDITELSNYIVETENTKFRNPNIKQIKLEYLKNIKQIMRDNIIDDFLK